ncbi:DUF4246 family protein, partial [Candidatus Bathyarchaeota archaeon]|nr:DUF4246 family protein [Candidatus Bathyarchaeota archaeon]
MEELRDKADIFKETGLVHVLDENVTIVKSDEAVPEALRKSLCEGVKVLENSRLKDWHPQSDGLVLDLVHPSLFPVAFGLTKVMKDDEVPLDGCLEYIGNGVTTVRGRFVKAPEGRRDPGRKTKYHDFGSFQWLPTDFELTESGPKLRGYINNLHPEEHRGLYG